MSLTNNDSKDLSFKCKTLRGGIRIHDDFPVIFTENLTKSYEKGSIKALDGVNLVIEQGDFVSIIGPSGSGKSTLLNMLGGLDKPTSGTVIIDGVDITKEKDLSELRSAKVGFIFQLHNLIPNLNALDNVEIPLIGTGMKEKEMKQRAKYLLEAVGLGASVYARLEQLGGKKFTISDEKKFSMQKFENGQPVQGQTEERTIAIVPFV